MTTKDEKFIQAMKDAVERRGRDYVYPRGEEGYYRLSNPNACLYTNTKTNEPACIIGLAMSLAGFPKPPEGDAADMTLEGLVSPRVAFAAWSAQNLQDNGHTWGEALDEFLREVEK